MAAVGVSQTLRAPYAPRSARLAGRPLSSLVKLRSLASQVHARLPNVPHRLSLGVFAVAQSKLSHSSTASESLYPLTSTLSSFFPVCTLGTAVWAAVHPAASSWLNPSLLAPEIGVSLVSLALAWAAEASMRPAASADRSTGRFLTQYGAMPALGFFASAATGLPLVPSVWLCLAGGCVGSMLGASLQPPTSARTAATDPESVHLGQAPESLQAFIARWGSREGIEAAHAASGPSASDAVAVPGAVSAGRVKEVVAQLEAAHSAGSYPTRQDMNNISRWGPRRRMVVAQAASAAVAAPAAAAAAVAAAAVAAAAVAASATAVSKAPLAAAAVTATPAANSSDGSVKLAVAQLEVAAGGQQQAQQQPKMQQRQAGNLMAAFTMERRMALEQHYSSLWGKKEAEAAAAAANPEAKTAPAGVTAEPVDPLAPFAASRRFALESHYSALWGKRRQLVQRGEATETVKPKAAVQSRDFLAPFARERRFALESHYSALWGKMRQQQQEAMGPVAASAAAAGAGSYAGALAPFGAGRRFAQEEHYATLWAAKEMQHVVGEAAALEDNIKCAKQAQLQRTPGWRKVWNFVAHWTGLEPGVAWEVVGAGQKAGAVEMSAAVV